MPTVCGFPKEFFADRAEVVPLMTRGVQTPFAGFAPAALKRFSILAFLKINIYFWYI